VTLLRHLTVLLCCHILSIWAKLRNNSDTPQAFWIYRNCDRKFTFQNVSQQYTSQYIVSVPENNILAYLLTSWSRVLLEKLTGSVASQEIPRIFGTRRFVTVFTSARHLSLSWANSIQSSQPPPTSWRSILILSSHLRLGLPNGSENSIASAKSKE